MGHLVHLQEGLHHQAATPEGHHQRAAVLLPARQEVHQAMTAADHQVTVEDHHQATAEVHQAAMEEEVHQAIAGARHQEVTAEVHHQEFIEDKKH